MKVNLEQNTPEWLEFRKTRVTATDFCVIAANNGLCNNLFNKSLNTLIKDKVESKQQNDNHYFELGRKYEPILLDNILIKVTLEYWDPYNHYISEIFVSDINNRIMASLDARFEFNNIDSIIYEIKTTHKPKDKLSALIEYYKYQVIHQCYVCGIPSGVLCIGFLDESDDLYEIKYIEIIPSEILDKSIWFAMCIKFLNALDQYSLVPKEDIDLFNEYKKLSEEIKHKEIRQDEIKKLLKQKYLSGVDFKEFSVRKQNRISNRYADFMKDINLELPDSYKSISEFYVIKGN